LNYPGDLPLITQLSSPLVSAAIITQNATYDFKSTFAGRVQLMPFLSIIKASGLVNRYHLQH
jgi:hypothetical protein